MSMERANITWGAKQLRGMVNNGKISFQHIVQRSYVWERSRKSALIESMIIGYPIPAVYAKRIETGSGERGSKIYYIMDGKQRLSTIAQYLNDEFELTELPPVSYMNEETGEKETADISGLKFSELPEPLRDYLNTITIGVNYFDNLTENEEREMFKRLNAGKPLSTKSRLLASCKDIHGLLDIGSHKTFEEMLTDKAKENKNQVALVMKVWCMLNLNVSVGEVSFESKQFNPLVENTEITEAEKLQIVNVCDYIYDVHAQLVEDKKKKVAKKIYTETHFVSLIPFFNAACNGAIDTSLMADWLTEVFDADGVVSNIEEYNEAATNGVAKSVNITARHEALESSFNEFFNAEEEIKTEIA